MGDLDILKEQGNYRVRLELDDSAEEPYDDGAVPVLQLSFEPYGSLSVKAFNSQAEPYLEAFLRIMHAAPSGSAAVERFERYARLCLGTVKVQSYNLGHVSQYAYLAFDTAAWAETVGAPAEHLATEDYLSDIRAWAEGDCWGWILEKQRHWTKTYADGETEQGSSWEHVDSCYGYYGRQYAAEAAEAALVNEASQGMTDLLEIRQQQAEEQQP